MLRKFNENFTIGDKIRYRDSINHDWRVYTVDSFAYKNKGEIFTKFKGISRQILIQNDLIFWPEMIENKTEIVIGVDYFTNLILKNHGSTGNYASIVGRVISYGRYLQKSRAKKKVY